MRHCCKLYLLNIIKKLVGASAIACTERVNSLDVVRAVCNGSFSHQTPLSRAAFERYHLPRPDETVHVPRFMAVWRQRPFFFLFILSPSTYIFMSTHENSRTTLKPSLSSSKLHNIYILATRIMIKQRVGIDVGVSSKIIHSALNN